MAARAAGTNYQEARGIKRALLEEQRAAWEQGRAPAPEDLLARWPTDPRRDEDVASVLLEDYHQRLRRSQGP